MTEDNERLCWLRASRCESGGCVEVAAFGDDVLVRNSGEPDGPMLRFTRLEWDEFVADMRAGQFQLG